VAECQQQGDLVELPGIDRNHPASELLLFSLKHFEKVVWMKACDALYKLENGRLGRYKRTSFSIEIITNFRNASIFSILPLHTKSTDTPSILSHYHT